MLKPRRESHMIGKSSTIGRREYSSQVSSTSSLPVPPPVPQPHSSSHGTIRVIHIFSPKVIKTDVANFRALVQRLTGRNTKRTDGSSSHKKRALRCIPESMCSVSHPNATQIFASSNRVEYIIPRSDLFSSSMIVPKTCYEPFSPRQSIDNLKSKRDTKPCPVSREPDSSDNFVSSSSSSQSTISNSPLNFLSEVSSRYFHGGHQSQPGPPSSRNCNNYGMSTQNVSKVPLSRSNNGSQQQHEEMVYESKPLMVDPFQSLSGYREKLQSSTVPQPAQRLSNFPAADRHVDDNCLHSMFTVRSFSEMDILTGLVTPGPLPEFSMPPPIVNNNSSFPSDNFSFPSLLPSSTNSSSLCRFAVQSPLRAGVSPFENF